MRHQKQDLLLLHLGTIQILRNQDFDLLEPQPPVQNQSLLMKQTNLML